jgi:hypothetical protein
MKTWQIYALGALAVTILGIGAYLMFFKKGKWIKWDWAGGQKYGRGLHIYGDVSEAMDWVPGDIVEVKSPTKEYNGLFEIVARGDDTAINPDGKPVMWEQLIGIPLIGSQIPAAPQGGEIRLHKKKK